MCHALDVNSLPLNDPNQLHRIVAQGMLENCRKLECGFLVWTYEQKAYRISSEDYTGTRKQGRLWWQGDKQALHCTFTEISGQGDTCQVDHENNLIQVFDGNEYRERLLEQSYIEIDTKSKISSDSYLRGLPMRAHAHEDSIIEQLHNMKRDGHSQWSVVHRNGEPLIQLKWIHQSGIGSQIYFFDPEKGCMLLRREFYTNGNLTSISKITLEEVVPGVWFPGRSDTYHKLELPEVLWEGAHWRDLTDQQKKKTITKETTTRVVLDLEQSRFNDCSAIPTDAFSLDIGQDIHTIIDYRQGDSPRMYGKDQIKNFAQKELVHDANEKNGVCPVAHPNLLIQPMKISETSEPGKLILKNLELRNHGQGRCCVAVQAVDLAQDKNSHWVPIDPNTPDVDQLDLVTRPSCRDWLYVGTPEDEIITIEPNTTESLDVNIDVPIGAQGTYWAALKFSLSHRAVKFEYIVPVILEIGIP
jgi:hypothetical protein